jgi:hypothetical protein
VSPVGVSGVVGVVGVRRLGDTLKRVPGGVFRGWLGLFGAWRLGSLGVHGEQGSGDDDDQIEHDTEDREPRHSLMAQEGGDGGCLA